MNQETFNHKFEVKTKSSKDFDEVVEFVLKYYSKQNPLRQIFRANEHEDDLFGSDRLRVAGKLEHCAFGCHEKSSGKLVAVGFGTVHDKQIEAIPNIDDPDTVSPSIYGQMKFAAWMERDLYEALNTEKFMILGIVAVHPDYTKMRIATHLTMLLEKLAIDNKCEYIAGLTMTRFFQVIMERLGYSVLREVKYEDYVDPVTGLKPNLNLSPIHTHSKLYFRKLKF